MWRVRVIRPEWFGRRCRIVVHGGRRGDDLTPVQRPPRRLGLAVRGADAAVRSLEAEAERLRTLLRRCYGALLTAGGDDTAIGRELRGEFDASSDHQATPDEPGER